MLGFFEPKSLTVIGQTGELVPQCRKCGLDKLCKAPKMPVDGEGRRKVLLVGEAPGETEDDEGKPFVGRAGDELWEVLWEIGVEREDCWITNSLICRPPKNDIKKYENSVGYCRPNLLNAIKKLQPDTIILLGGYACESLLEHVYRKGDVGGVMRWRGFRIPCQKLNAWICPVTHPSFVMRRDRDYEAKKLFFLRDLQAAFALTGKPYSKPDPHDYASRVEIVMECDKAAKLIDQFTHSDALTVFDYETNMLKPDADDAEIVCCSISDGITTIVFPWKGVAIRNAMRRFLRSNVPKGGQNIKFESAWSAAKLGVWPRNWKIDVMQTAHILDNREKVCGLDFQMFAQFGITPWDDKVAPYLDTGKGAPGYKKNRIHECPLPDLMLYCGLDSLFEHKLARRQQKELNGRI